MAAGLAVVGTRTGGTGEVLCDGETGLAFAAGDARCLAKQIVRLATDRDLCNRLSEAGRKRVLEQFSLSRMADELELVLRTMASDEN